MHAIIFAGGTLQPGKAVDAALAHADLIIAADSGADLALRYGLTPSIIIGDFDSLVTPLRTLDDMDCEIIHAAQEKDETDSELAVQIAIERGASAITILGGLGGLRFDHTIANTLLLAGYEIPLRIVDGDTTCWLLRGPGSTHVSGKPGDLLSLLPLTAEATGIETHHLYYPLRGSSLAFGKPRGVSNVLTHNEAEVSLASGMLLLIHTTV
ncbi:MAG TPA: thiamine diphosphokinase [Ktedonosporobacter sp.]|jgi:thiamine pyrophosphokinase|nr:thiamine diphosphokinase [Ktedonosporobacter sp.]